MAGQPPEPSYQPAEPSFQPAGQDQNLTQGRPAWQPPAYEPPATVAGQPGSGQQGWAAPAYGAPDQGYAAPPPPDRGYPAPGQPGYGPAEQPGYNGEQTFVAPPPEQQPGYGSLEQGYPDQAYPGQGTGGGYPGYQAPGYAGQPGQGGSVPPPQWQAAAPPARPRPQGEKGIIGSLLDFSFTSFVTPKIIKFLYRLFALWTALIAIVIAVIGFKTGGIAGGLFTLVIVDSIFVLLSLGIYRVVLEAFMVVHRIHDETKQIRQNTAGQD